MSKPFIHARNSANYFGGKPENYIDIHEFLDSSRKAFPDVRHRALTHNTWFITTIIPRIFGTERVNSSGTHYSPEEVAERHVLEDFAGRFIPSAQDWIENIEFKAWMDNGKGNSFPRSHKKLKSYIKDVTLPRKKKKSSKKDVEVLLSADDFKIPPKLDSDLERKRGCNAPPGVLD